jgi:hypothetical protein
LSNSSVDTSYQYVASKDERLSIENGKPDRIDADEIPEDVSPNNQTNLTIKGIIAIRAMSAMSLAAAHIDDANKYKVCNSSSTIIHFGVDPPIGYK